MEVILYHLENHTYSQWNDVRIRNNLYSHIMCEYTCSHSLIHGRHYKITDQSGHILLPDLVSDSLQFSGSIVNGPQVSCQIKPFFLNPCIMVFLLSKISPSKVIIVIIHKSIGRLCDIELLQGFMNLQGH